MISVLWREAERIPIRELAWKQQLYHLRWEVKGGDEKASPASNQIQRA